MKRGKFILILFTICIAISVVVGGTIAYFTHDQAMESVFTAGNVYIELSEAAVKTDPKGNLVQDTAKERILGKELGNEATHNYGMIFPGQSIYKDPTIKNVGNTPAWVAAKVILTDGTGDIHKVLGYENDDKIDVKLLLSGGALSAPATIETWNGISSAYVSEDFALIQTADRTAGRYVFYFFMEREMVVNEEFTLFTLFKIDESCTNEMLKEFVDFRISVQAFAVQTFGFNSCFEAMTTAFSTHFDIR